MSITEITGKVNTLGNAWENFKKVNDTRLREIEKKGNADPLYSAQLERINAAIDNQKSRLNEFETAANRPAKELKHYQKADAGFVSEYKNAFHDYVRKGNSQALDSFETKSLSVGTDSDGGYLVTPSLSGNIEKIVFESSPMRQIASIEEISTDTLEVVVDNDSMAAGWTTETGAITDTTTSQFSSRLEKVFGKNSKISNRLGKQASDSVKDEISDLLDLIKDELLRELKGEVDGLVKQAAKEILGNNAFSKGFGNAVDTALGQVIAGREIDARSVANSAARAFTPIVGDFVRKSSAQAADELSSLFGMADRNS